MGRVGSHRPCCVLAFTGGGDGGGEELLPAGVNAHALVFALLHVDGAHMAAEEPGILPVLVGGVTRAEVAAHLAALDREGALGGPGVDVSLLAATHVDVWSFLISNVFAEKNKLERNTNH